MRLPGPDHAAGCTLTPLRYQFADHADDEYDWLVVRGEVTAGGRSWVFEDPCLTAREAEELARWLRRLAGGSGPVPDLRFLEPNLTMSATVRGTDVVEVRVGLSHESAPPGRGPSAGAGARDRVVVAGPVTRSELAAAADRWAGELARLPRR